MGRRWTYRPEVLAELERFGIAPKPHTDPARVAELLKAIYTFEIRELKFRRREAERVLGPQPIGEYRRQVEALKGRYPLLALPARMWVLPEGDEGGSGGG